MSSIERTAYPRYPQKRQIDQKEVIRFYTFTNEELLFIHKTAKTDKLKLSLAIQLKTFQKLGYFIELKETPEEIIQQLKRILNAHYRLSFGYRSKKIRYRHRKLIRQFLGVKQWGAQIIDGRLINQGLRQAIKFASETSHSMNNIPDIINAVIEHLVQTHFELPPFNTLDRLVRHTRHVVNNRIFSSVQESLKSNNLIKRFNDLLECTAEIQRTEFNKLKTSPKRPLINKIHDFIKHAHGLESFGDLTLHLAFVSKVKLEQFAEEVKTLTADELRGISQAKRYTLIASLIITSQSDAKDTLSIMYCRLITIADKQAKSELTKRLEKTKEDTCKIANLLKQIAENAQSNDDELSLATNVREYLVSEWL